MMLKQGWSLRQAQATDIHGSSLKDNNKNEAQAMNELEPQWV